MDNKYDKIRENIHELAATFFSRESNRQSLITVTGVDIESRGGRATIKITVIPESEEKRAVEFANRQMHDFKEYVQDNSRIGRIPFFIVIIDHGEKNRQKIDEISSKI